MGNGLDEENCYFRKKFIIYYLEWRRDIVRNIFVFRKRERDKEWERKGFEVGVKDVR